MCGVAGILSPGSVDPGRLQAAQSALKHRGPDGEGLWLGQGVGLAHTRLAIRSVGGPQPVHRDGAVAVVNGELYGGAHDVAQLLPLFQEYGPECVERLRGEFAFLIWDGHALFAARDAFGVRPLFYTQSGGELLLASEIKALAAMGCALRWDEASMRAYLQTGLLPMGRTLYEGVFELPPGHRLRATHRTLKVERWWEPPLSGGSVATNAQLREAIIEAVELRLVSDRPVACALSGGVDSGLVYALAARRGTVRAYTLAFDSGEVHTDGLHTDEHHVIRVSEDELAARYAETVFAVEAPLANAHAVARLILCERVRDDGAAVLLTGEGADELFGGYAHFAQDAGHSSDGLNLLRGPLEAALPAVDQRLGSSPAFLRRFVADGLMMRQVLDKDFLSRGEEPIGVVLESLGLPDLRDCGRLEVAMQLWSRTVLPGYNLSVLNDRVAMACGVEDRPPLLDRPLAELAATLPPDQKVGPDGGLKPAFREAIRGLVPEATRTRAKAPFLAPSPTGALLELIQDELRSTTLPFVSPLRLHLALDLLPEAPADRARIDRGLNVLLSLSLLQKQLRVS